MHPLRRSVLSTVIFLFLATSLLVVAQAPLRFVPIAPCRVVDTRGVPNGPFRGPAIAGLGSRDFAIPQGACGIPSNASAYALNATAIPHGSLGFLTVWPSGQTRPVLSTLNSADGRIKANGAIVPAGVEGAISVYATDATDVVLDINGYFVPASASSLAFFPVTPCRVADTRRAGGPLGGPSLQSGQERDFPVLPSLCAVPDSAQGYSLNFTVVPKFSLSYLTVWPAGHPRPTVSTLNALTGTITANAAIVPAGLTGAISVYATDDTDLVIDIDGYFAPADSGPGPLSLYALAPCRVVDTRNSTHTFAGTLAVGVLGSACGVPSAQAYVLNATVIPQIGTPLGFLTLWPNSEGQPLASTLNAADGAIASNMAIVPTLNGSVNAFASSATDLILDVFSYFAPTAPLNITTASLPSGTVNYGYATTLGAVGGVVPYAWIVASGTLPPGLNLNASTGVISGAPTIAGSYPLTMQVSDAQSPPATASVPLSITVNTTLTALSVVTTSLPSGTQNTTYSAMLAATGGVMPYTWSRTGGSLPVGLSLHSATGAITGTPSGAGVANFTVQVADSEMPPVVASAQLSITIQPALPLNVTTSSLPSGTAGTAYNATVAAIGGVVPYAWSVLSGNFPAGLSLDIRTGAITGTPVVAGTSNFTVQVVDSASPPATAAAQLSILVKPQGGGGDPARLTGNYAFYLNGFNFETGAWTIAGSFISDGAGNITSGDVDANSIGGQPFHAGVTGTYAVASNGLNTLTIQGQSWGPMTFAFVLDSTGSGRIIEYDDLTGQGSRGSGLLRKADSSAFALSKLSGGYVFGMTGSDSSEARMVDVGVFNLASGNISNGRCDMNDGGTYSTCTFTGSLPTINGQTGRGVSTVQSSNGASHQAIYVVSASELIMEQIDSVPDTQIPLLVGPMLQQSGAFSQASLNGNAVFYMQDIHFGDGADQSIAAIFSFDGSGNFNIVAMDEDLAGTIIQDPPSHGACSVQANGAVDFGTGNPAGFLVSQNKGFFVGRGASSIFGTMEPQTGGPFSNASLQGTYAAGSLAPLDTSANNEVMAGAADGNGTLTLGGDSSSRRGIDQYSGTVVTYNVASNGRGTGAAEGDTAPSIVYMISPTRWIVLQTKSDARLDVFQH